MRSQSIFLPMLLSLALVCCVNAGRTSVAAAERRPDIVLADFEGDDYGAWKATGEAFGRGPARGALPGQMPVAGFHGRGLVNSYLRGDGTTGRLTSPPLKIERNYLKFLIGGGGFPDKTCIRLLIDGRVVRSAVGRNTQPGGSEQLDWDGWDVRDLIGKTAVLEIVDEAVGGWGHITIDRITASDRGLPTLREVRRKIVFEKRYLLLPIRNGAVKRILNITVDGRLVRQFEIELAETNAAPTINAELQTAAAKASSNSAEAKIPKASEPASRPDWWAFLDIEAMRGRTAELSIRDRLSEDFSGLDAIDQGDSLRGADDLYREPLRPQFHFTSKRGWLNDPNGLVYHDGEYHLFYQHNPYGRNWGNMHWGHAVSRDLVRWRELGEAIYPNALGTAFSGSAVVDRKNTTGFAKGNEPAIVCMYTAAGGTSPESKDAKFSQCLVYSTDRGRTWTPYAGNPVLPHLVGGNRDPKVIWYAPGNKWIMALYLDGETFALFDSPDMKQWRKLSEIVLKGDSECPEFFEIPVAGENTTRWIFYGGKGTYQIGRFDGTRFTPESGPHALNRGDCFYASQTYNDIPVADGRRILIPWGTVNLPDAPFNQMMGFPIELTLRPTPEGLRLFAQPVREIESLRIAKHERRNVVLQPGENPLAGERGELFDIATHLAVKDAEEFGFELRGERLTYDVKRRELVCKDKRVPLAPTDGTLRFRILVDRAGFEVFADDGRVYMPMQGRPHAGGAPPSIFTRGGSIELLSLDVHRLKSAWEEKIEGR